MNNNYPVESEPAYPLLCAPVLWCGKCAGDAIVAFTRKDIFTIKSQIESRTNHKCCVVYGQLPQETRAHQVRVSLPIICIPGVSLSRLKSMHDWMWTEMDHDTLSSANCSTFFLSPPPPPAWVASVSRAAVSWSLVSCLFRLLSPAPTNQS